LAVPRALLRPRVIRPGDPVLRVKTDESIVSVVALFPFGLVQPLRYLSSEDIWQTRSLDESAADRSGDADPIRFRRTLPVSRHLIWKLPLPPSWLRKARRTRLLKL
jgi:hypothetical protein